MGASVINGTGTLLFKLTKTVTGFATVDKEFSISLGTDFDVATYTDAYAARLSIASGSNTDVTLFASLTDLLGNTVASKTKLAAFIVKVTGGTSCDLKISPGASNPVTGWLVSSSPAAETPSLTIPAPGANTGLLYMKFPTHLTLSNTVKVLNFAASGGSGTLTVDVAFVLG